MAWNLTKLICVDNYDIAKQTVCSVHGSCPTQVYRHLKAVCLLIEILNLVALCRAAWINDEVCGMREHEVGLLGRTLGFQYISSAGFPMGVKAFAAPKPT
jgi:hypothetical protein